jgi:two-component system chemotaxis response regulator CheY
MSETYRTVVLVGHCGPDVFLLRSAVSRALPGVKLSSANDDAELERFLRPDALLLVNRVLDGELSVGNGIELIRNLAQRPNSPAMMLISNFPESQQAAIDAGALPGFGKAQLYQPQTIERLQTAARLASDSQPASTQ